jgi:hypothetical protein
VRRLLALLSVSVVVGLAGSARADPDVSPSPSPAPTSDEAGFLASLQAAGIHYSQADVAVSAAEVVCRLVGNGMSGAQVLTALQSRNPGLTTEHALQFIAIAVHSYCPQLASASTAGPETAQSPPPTEGAGAG